MSNIGDPLLIDSLQYNTAKPYNTERVSRLSTGHTPLGRDFLFTTAT